MSATTLSDEVYERLRDEIVKGLIRPNERLVELDLAERLGVSRTPVRESLKRLSAEGLIHGGRHHLVVREHAPEEIREIYESRAALKATLRAWLRCEPRKARSTRSVPSTKLT